MWVSYSVPPCHMIQVGTNSQGPALGVVGVRPSTLDHTEYPYCMAVVVDVDGQNIIYHPSIFVSCVSCIHQTIPRVK